MSIKLMSRVWDETAFQGNELLVFLCLADYANDEGYCWPSHLTMARRCRCSDRQVRRIIANLKAEGFLTIERRFRAAHRQDSNGYQMHFPKRADMMSSREVKRADICDTTGGHLAQKRADIAMSYDPSLIHKDPSDEPKASFGAFEDYSDLDCPL